MKNFKIGDKITRIPLIQGGMGVGISLGRLAGSVAKEGGVGVISTAQIGYREADFDKNPAAANERAIGSEMKKARAISPDGIIGYNIMVALKEYASHVKAAVKAGADIIISGAGLPTELPELVKGSLTKIAPIVSTDKSAKVILKYWDRKYKRTADLVVIEGPQAGGHLGFHKDELEMTLNEQLIRRVGSQGQNKTYLIALKLAQFAFLTRKGQTTPILLLDDIFDKLDAARVAEIIKLVSGDSFGQIFITDTNRKYLDEILQAMNHDYALFRVEQGEVQPMEDQP